MSTNMYIFNIFNSKLSIYYYLILLMDDNLIDGILLIILSLLSKIKKIKYI